MDRSSSGCWSIKRPQMVWSRGTTFGLICPERGRLYRPVRREAQILSGGWVSHRHATYQNTNTHEFQVAAPESRLARQPGRSGDFVLKSEFVPIPLDRTTIAKIESWATLP